MSGKNRQLVTDEPVEFRNNQLKFKTSRKLSMILEESMNIPQINESNTGRCMSTCNQLALESLGS